MKILSKIFIILIIFLFPLNKINLHTIDSKSLFSNNHIIVKLKKINYISTASLNIDSKYENTLKKIFTENNINVTKINKLFPYDFKNDNSLYQEYELETFYKVFFEEKIYIPDLCNIFSSKPEIDFTEPDFIGEAAGKKNYNTIPNDEYFSRQWGLFNNGSQRTTLGKPGKPNADMNVLKGWEIETGDENVIVAILDSGVKTDHPDLSARIWINKGEIKNGRDDDGNGFIDDIYGYNFAYDNPNVKDDGGHGTNIAGTIGAVTNNIIGYAGIDQKCRLMVCKNLDNDNLGEYSWWAASLYYAANNGANIINMSEGGYDYSKTLETAINYAYNKGCLIVASMMNKNNNDSYYPAAFKNVLAVGATDTDDSRCREFTWGGGSNWGNHIAVVAPGNKIYGLDYKDNSNFDVYWSGTSQSTAYVSGIASILLGQNKQRTNKDLREIITRTAIDLVGDPREDKPGWDPYYGYGRVDLYEALTFNNYSSGKKDIIKDNNENIDDNLNTENNGSVRAKAKESKSNDDNDNPIKDIKPKPKQR